MLKTFGNKAITRGKWY